MEDEDPTPASSTPPPITADASPTASPPVSPENRDPEDDSDDGEDDGEDDEEQAGEAERCDRGSHSPPPVTISKSADSTLAVAIPKPSPTPAASGREDCWSEGATWTLIEAWGDRHLRAQAEPQSHQRGGLRQKDWEEVADAVCSRDGGGKQAKSEGQCKNRIDTLKKKYKVERIKPHSSWPYFRRLNDLLAADYEDGGVGVGNGVSSRLPAGVGFGSFRHQLQQLQMKKKKRTTKKRSHRQLLQSVRPPPFLSSPPQRQAKEEYSSDGLPPANGKSGKMKGQEGLLRGGPIPAGPVVVRGAGGPEAGIRDLARAVMRLGEVYERVESTKLRQAEEMEKRRMGLAKELEVQRMDFFMKTVMELTQRNHKKPKRLPAPCATENHSAAAPVATNASSRSNKSGDSGGLE